MKFLFNPQRSDTTLTISVLGSVVTINNTKYNLQSIIDGSCIYVTNNVDNMSFKVYKPISGILEVHLPLPYNKDTELDTSIVHEVTTTTGTVNVPGQAIIEYDEQSIEYTIDWSKAELPIVQLTSFQRDQQKYKKRADVQSELLAWMAADNMSRVRNGTWTIPQLTGLLNDPAIKAAQTYMSTLSFELAAQAINSATVVELTPEIKLSWINKLAEHYYSTT